MDFLQPATWVAALATRAEQPQAVVLQGGTDVMVELNYDRHRPPALLDLGRVPELTGWSQDGDTVRLGAGVPYSRIIAELAGLLPGLAMASRTVGSPQIRNRGSVGGNLGAASPAGDTHPVLLAVGARVVVESVRGARTLPADQFYVGVKRNALAPDELIREVLLPVATGPQQYSKIGTRNAMVIAVAAFGLALHPDRREVGTGIGSAAPTPRRAVAAEAFAAQSLAEQGFWESRAKLPESLTTRFGDLVAAAASPIDDVRGTARYRAHALSVMARRSFTWAWTQYQNEGRACAP
jgi:CO/xanthine dehydrogenase FAD-binding subunit